MSMKANVAKPAASRGLDTAEAARRLVEHGPNEIARQPPPSAWAVLLSQLHGAMIGLLVGACALSAAMGEIADAVAIGVILVLNALVGFLQEFRAERAMQALRTLTAPRARVLRDGRTVTVAAAEIVPGDVLVLEAGDVVAADGRVLEAWQLSTSEAALTGESIPVEKRTEPAAPDAPLAERSDRVFLGTSVATGSGFAEVTATGMATELGRIARLLATAKVEPTPLQRRLDQVGRTLLLLCIVVVVVVAALGLLRGDAWSDVLLSAVALAVAAVPEGLAAIVTIALAIGVQRMAGRNVLVRRLLAVETLGCTTAICTDKTGTLTTGVMAVRELWGPDHRELIDAAAACCDAQLDATARAGSGDPTEVAILVAAGEWGISREAIEAKRPRVAVDPFDSVRKRMSIWRSDGLVYVKGAIESVLPQCDSTTTAGAQEANRDMASRGLRVLAVAVGEQHHEATPELLRLRGVIGLADPPRSEAIDAVRETRRAGITTVMITGDHPVTAAAIAREIGILLPGEDADERVHARATPEDKLRIVRDLKDRGAVVAMTGDGVNDAPALREAHIGIAMGRTGTEVARETAAMILTDDNFASIVAAVREGRGVFENIRKTLVYLLAGNAGELMVVLGAALAGMPVPLTPLQILWINLVTDGLPALALVMDPPDPDAMRQPPRGLREPILGSSQWRMVVLTGALQAGLTIGVFAATLERGLPVARNLAFSVLVFAEVLRAFSARSATRTFWETGAFTNLRLVGVVALIVLVQIGIHHTPAAQRLFDIGEISAVECVLSVTLGLVPVTVLEIVKLVRRRLQRGDGGRRKPPSAALLAPDANNALGTSIARRTG